MSLIEVVCFPQIERYARAAWTALGVVCCGCMIVAFEHYMFVDHGPMSAATLKDETNWQYPTRVGCGSFENGETGRENKWFYGS